MKERLIRFLFGILYIGLMAALLIFHVQSIAGEVERLFAVAETLALAIPAVIILALYIRLKNRGQPSQDRMDGGKLETEAKPEAESKPKSESEGETRAREASVQESGGGQAAPEICYMEQLEARLQPFSLSKRELEVAWLLYRGYTNRQIGEELFIAETTVKKHVTHIYEKMQVSGRKEYKEKVRKS